MTKPKPAPPQALVVVSHALQGSLDEKIKAADQIAAALAQLMLNGWDTVHKVKAAFWLADGSGEHPAVFVQNHYVMLIKGRLTVEPKWEYMIRKLKETVPSFRFEVLTETDLKAKVRMSDGADTHEVEYTLEDARRQGLMGRDNAWSSGSTREMCLKMAIKRAARRLGVGRVMPWVETTIADEHEHEPSGAEVIDEDERGDGEGTHSQTVEGGGNNFGVVDSNTAAEPVSSPAPAPSPEPQRAAQTRLGEELTKVYGKLTKHALLEKAAFIYVELRKTEGAVVDTPAYKKAEEIPDDDAERMIAFLAQRAPAWARQPQPAPEAPPAEAPPPAEVAVPPPVAPPPPAAVADEQPEPDQAYELFMNAVARSRKVFGRKFLVEAPPGYKKYWFVDQAIFSQAGDTESFKVMDNGEIIVGVPKLTQLTKLMLTECDRQERGGR